MFFSEQMKQCVLSSFGFPLESISVFVSPQHLLSQQKEGDAEEKQKMMAEKEAQQKRIAQLVEETAKLKTELVRYTAFYYQALWDNIHNAARDGETSDSFAPLFCCVN